MALTMATAANVEPGPTGVSRPSMATSASACGRAQVDDEVDLVEEAAADLGTGRRHRLRDRRDRDDPQAAPPAAAGHLDRDRGRPPAENTIITSAGPKLKLERMTSASPGIRSMAIAWRWPFEPTTWVWNVIDSSTIGLKPGYEP